MRARDSLVDRHAGRSGAWVLGSVAWRRRTLGTMNLERWRALAAAAGSMNAAKLRVLVVAWFKKVFDQDTAFGRLAFVQVAMQAGDTLVTISLAGSLFFSLSPDAAEGKVLLYLLLTVAPFAVVSPLLGPAIDASRGARRFIVFSAAAGRVILCLFMAESLHSLWLFPEAFCVLVLSKLYLVTRGALVPEMADAAVLERRAPGPEVDGLASHAPPTAVEEGFAGYNAQLTLLATITGFVISVPGIGLLKLINGTAVLVLASFVFVVAAAGGLRLTVPPRLRAHEPLAADEADEDVGMYTARPLEDREVILGLTASATVRLTAGFLTFLIAFGLRRSGAPLWWYGVAFATSGVGSLVGLFLVRRLRRVLTEQLLLSTALAIIVVSAAAAALSGSLPAQAALAGMAGIAAAICQPSFDALTQRRVAPAAQGRVFARLAVRQQLAWVFGALIPVAISMPFAVGDGFIAGVAALGLGGYLFSRLVLVRASPELAT